jgi:hypothetical protein
MKNVYQVTANCAYIELTNTTSSLYLTASLGDVDSLAEHRWRWIRGTAATVIEEAGQYVSTTLDSILLGVERDVSVYHRDGNPLNYQRENLTFFNSKHRNQYLTNTKSSKLTYLLVHPATTILVDSDCKNLIHPYTWSVRTTRGKQIVQADYKKDGKRRHVQLARLILGLNEMDRRPVRYKNGDTLDCRRKNLELDKETVTTPTRKKWTRKQRRLFDIED